MSLPRRSTGLILACLMLANGLVNLHHVHSPSAADAALTRHQEPGELHEHASTSGHRIPSDRDNHCAACFVLAQARDLPQPYHLPSLITFAQTVAEPPIPYHAGPTVVVYDCRAPPIG